MQNDEPFPQTHPCSLRHQCRMYILTFGRIVVDVVRGVRVCIKRREEAVLEKEKRYKRVGRVCVEQTACMLFDVED